MGIDGRIQRFLLGEGTTRIPILVAERSEGVMDFSAWVLVVFAWDPPMTQIPIFCLTWECSRAELGGRGHKKDIFFCWKKFVIEFFLYVFFNL